MASGFGTVIIHSKQQITTLYNLATTEVLSNYYALFEMIGRHGSTLGLAHILPSVPVALGGTPSRVHHRHTECNQK